MPTTMKWILIGASDIAATRIVPSIRARGDDIVAVVSRSGEHVKTFAATHQIPLSATTLSTAVSATKADCAYISSHNERHYEHARAALSAGLHVLCEKPLTLSAEEGEELARMAEDRGLVLAVNHHLPGSALHRTVRELVADGAIGDLLSARVAHAVSLPDRLRGWRVSTDSPGAGVILDITSHDASVLNPLLGTPIRVSAITVTQADWNTGDAPDAAMVTIEYETRDGRRVLAQTHDAFTVAYEPTRLIVHGTAGVVTAHDAMTQDADGTIILTNADGVREIQPDHRDLYSIVLDAFASAAAGEGRPTVTARDGIAAMNVALGAAESARTGATVELARQTNHSLGWSAV